jgi:hypothetical protein
MSDHSTPPRDPPPPFDAQRIVVALPRIVFGMLTTSAVVLLVLGLVAPPSPEAALASLALLTSLIVSGLYLWRKAG